MNALSFSQNTEARHSELLSKIQEEVKMFEVPVDSGFYYRLSTWNLKSATKRRTKRLLS